jgi:protein-tyrosine phosphatase
MYLIATQNMTTDEAIAFIQSKRAIAFIPKANFEKSIRGFEEMFNRDVRPVLAAK